MGISCQWKDSRELIQTNAAFGFAAVDFPATDIKVKTFLQTVTDSVIVVPGFIAADSQGATTTLGRGGSDLHGRQFWQQLLMRRSGIWTDVSV